jgi:N-acetylmuramoyl-L-alanine amidase
MSAPPLARRALVAVALVGTATWLASCGGSGDGDATSAGTQPSPSVTSSTSSSTTTPTTTASTTTTTTTAPEPASVVPSAAEDVAALQWELGTRGYAVTDPVGEYGSGTRHAVMAFQKLHGLQRDGIAGPQTLGALATAGPVAPRLGRHHHIEVDLAAQVVIVVGPDGSVTALNATTGAAATTTPTGGYRVLRQVDGWDPGPYGPLYRPKYFVGGIAFHGGYPVLAAPASHGCVRLPDPSVDWLWSSGVGAIGTPVDVY